MPKIICTKCERDYVPDKIGVCIADMAYDPPMAMAVASGDVWKCPACGHKIIAGMGAFEHDDAEVVRRLRYATMHNKPIVRSFESNAMRDKFYAPKKKEA